MKHYYRVNEYVTAFNGNSFNHTEDFRANDLKNARGKAAEYFKERQHGFNSGNASFVSPFHAPKGFKYGEHSAYSLTMTLIEVDDDGNEHEYFIDGEDEETVAEGREYEASILNSFFNHGN